MNWLTIGHRIPLREGEDEGGSGVGGGEGGSTGGSSNDMSAIEARLARMSEQVNRLQSSRQTDDLRERIRSHDASLTSKLTENENKITEAEKQLATAFDEGEGTAIAKAQRALSEAISARDQAKVALEGFRQRIREAEKKKPEAPRHDNADGNHDTTNLNAWKNRHADWYGVDKEMTKTAHSIDQSIREAGVIPVGSKEYFDAIDRRMKQQYPDRFSGAPGTSNGSGGGDHQGNSSGKGRISQSVYDGWRRMGIDVSDPKTVERMLKHRQTAVDKGILPAEPIRDRVMSR